MDGRCAWRRDARRPSGTRGIFRPAGGGLSSAGPFVVAASALIVVGREIDFNLALLDNNYLSSSALGNAPPNVVSWVVHVALVLILGILWFDWLLGMKGDFYAAVVAPLAVSFAVMAAVSVYQLFGNVTFLNETIFAAQGRLGHNVRRERLRNAGGTLDRGLVCALTG